MLDGMTSTQIAVRISDELLQTIDDMIEQGLVESRADAVRQALGRMVDQIERLRIDRAIVEGYRRTPATEDEQAAAQAALRKSIEDETW